MHARRTEESEQALPQEADRWGAGMNGGPVAERVYDTLRQLILGLEFRPGDRLDPAMLAERLVASATPVREALNVLCGEQLVEARRSGGFYLPALDEPALKDMYGWAQELSLFAMRSWSEDKGTVVYELRSRPRDYTDRISAVLDVITRHSNNGEHRRAMASLNARLHAVRIVEIEVLPDAIAELADLEFALEHDDRPALRRGLHTYHRQRIRVAARLVRARYRATPR